MFKNIKILIILLCLSHNVVHSESNLDQILVSPGQRDATIFDSLSSIEVITSENMRILGYASVDEILSNSSSINIGSPTYWTKPNAIFSIRCLDSSMISSATG